MISAVATNIVMNILMNILDQIDKVNKITIIQITLLSYEINTLYNCTLHIRDYLTNMSS